MANGYYVVDDDVLKLVASLYGDRNPYPLRKIYDILNNERRLAGKVRRLEKQLARAERKRKRDLEWSRLNAQISALGLINPDLERNMAVWARCTDKVKFPKVAALEERRKIHARGGVGNAWKCSICDFWHVQSSFEPTDLGVGVRLWAQGLRVVKASRP